jgi:hypothetical protein
MIVKISNARLAFPALFKPAQFAGNQGEPKFSATFLIPKSDAQVKGIKAIIQNVAVEKWADKGAKILEELTKGDRICLHDGDNKDQYDGFSGCMSINASNKLAPKILDRDRNILSEDNGKPYAGCYVNASVDIWAQDNQYGKRINATLRGVQFVKDGDAFVGGGPVNDDEFEDLADTGEGLV